jgi:hypothetical protein
MGSSLPLTSTDSGTSMPIESGEESISSMQLTKGDWRKGEASRFAVPRFGRHRG